MNYAEEAIITHGLSGNNLFVDIGSGPGIITSAFIEKFGFKKLLALDVSEHMLKHLPQYVTTKSVHVTCQNADVEDCRFDTGDLSADLAIACRTLMYVFNIENVFKEVARVLKPGGFFGFNCFTHAVNSPSPRFCEATIFPMDCFAHSQKKIQELTEMYGFEQIKLNDKVQNKNLSSIPLNVAIFFLRKM